jgi:hypothetical protein
MFHLPQNIISKFSSNPNILKDLDETRKLRNYVYHHNILFSLGKDALKSAVILVLKNLPNKKLKESFINKINELSNKFSDLDDGVLININEKIKSVCLLMK